MSLNQSFISDFSEYYRWSQKTKIKYKLHYGWCTGRCFTAGDVLRLPDMLVIEWIAKQNQIMMHRIDHKKSKW